MPVVVTWALMLQQFEGINDASTTNFVFNLTELMKAATGKNPKTLRDLDSSIKKIISPVIKSFGDLNTFAKYIRACAWAEIINSKARETGPDAHAWKEANSWLGSMLHDNLMLSLYVMEKAMLMAEDLIQRDGKVPDTKTFVGQVEEESESGKPGVSNVTSLQKEVKKLRAMVAKNSKPPFNKLQS